jgi:hypothetical protein
MPVSTGPQPQPTFVNAMFEQEAAGTFAEGYVFKSGLDLDGLRGDAANGYWRCDVAHNDDLTWSDQVYDLFGLAAGSPILRDWAVARYSEASKEALRRVRKFGLTRDFGFILDAEIDPEGAPVRWIRVLAVPVIENGRLVALHGVKRAI